MTLEKSGAFPQRFYGCFKVVVSPACPGASRGHGGTLGRAPWEGTLPSCRKEGFLQGNVTLRNKAFRRGRQILRDETMWHLTDPWGEGEEVLPGGFEGRG